MRSVLAAMVGISMVSAPALAAPKGCVAYEPGVVKLNGKLRRSTVWTLDLAKPFCIEGREGDKTGMYPTLDAVKTAILLGRKDAPMENYVEMTDRDVVITGTLYHKFDMGGDQIMMNVATVTKPPAAAPPPHKE